MKNRNLMVIQLLIAVVFLSSCAKLPIYKSKNYPPSKTEESRYPIATAYDKKKNIHYGIAENDSDIFIQFCFHDQKDIEKIMQGGIKVYFDPNVKKGKTYSLSIEKSDKSQQGFPQMSSTGQTTQQNREMGNTQMPTQNQQGSRNNQNDEQNFLQFNEMICREFTKLTWKKGDNEYIFYRNSVFKEKIDVQLQAENPNGLIVTIRMPREEIPANKNGMFSLGIEAGGKKQSSETGGQGNNSFSQMPPSGGPGGMGGGPGGGMGGGFGGMGGGPGGMGPGGAGGPSNSQSSSKSFSFWLKVQLQ